ncbi:hypothetical protein F2Q69_00057650 [Brassica cretica]|uniref:Uncharacterized protein n=1 Tax=Brassica cretica TaxID=69181 RepID=A0A8S9N8I7_BRACR|nr:hypothetical protein F2Q69_00057650 [Brassica cretica]
MGVYYWIQRIFCYFLDLFLSDSNKRFVYDVGAYNSDDDKADQNGMRDFLNEMAAMMNLCIVFEQVQDLFNEMFQGDAAAFPSLSSTSFARISICLLCNLRKPTAVVLLKRVAIEVKTLMGAVLIRRDAEADLNSALRPVEIIGNLASIEKAEKLINEVIAQSEGEGIPAIFVGVIIGLGDYQEHADKVESTDSGCPFYL